MKKIRATLIAVFIMMICLPASLNSSVADGNNQKIIALTFDDGPRPKILLGDDGLVNLLSKYDINATFFLIGAELRNRENRGAAEKLFLKGHELDNHTYTHSPLVPFYKKYGEQKVRQDIECASKLIKEITGKNPEFLRPPTWSVNADVKKIIESENLNICTISMPGVKMPVKYEDVNSEDYCFAGKRIASYCSGEMRRYYPDDLKNYVLQLVKNREKRGIYSHIIVFHELPKSKDALKELIPELQKQGYKFVTLEQYYKEVR